MKKFVKALSLIIALLCMAFAFAACNGEQSENNDNNGTKGAEYYITYKGTRIELGKKADSVLSALGEPKSEKELPDCGDFGKQTKYEYDNFMIYTLTNDNGETIDQIEFLNDMAETEKGICIGDASDDVISAYGNATQKSNTSIIYTKAFDGYKLHLKFTVKDGEIDKINFIREFNTAE